MILLESHLPLFLPIVVEQSARKILPICGKSVAQPANRATKLRHQVATSCRRLAERVGVIIFFLPPLHQHSLSFPSFRGCLMRDTTIKSALPTLNSMGVSPLFFLLGSLKYE
jgi:hypothetical protein